jgi:hypothetical protein
MTDDSERKATEAKFKKSERATDVRHGTCSNIDRVPGGAPCKCSYRNRAPKFKHPVITYYGTIYCTQQRLRP